MCGLGVVAGALGGVRGRGVEPAAWGLGARGSGPWPSHTDRDLAGGRWDGSGWAPPWSILPGLVPGGRALMNTHIAIREAGPAVIEGSPAPPTPINTLVLVK